MSNVKKAEAFTRMVDFCTGFGGNYNPSRQTLQINALNSQVIQIRAALDAVKVAKANYDLHVNQRKQAFDLVPRILAGILRRLEASGTQPEQLDDARAYVRQFVGASPRSRTRTPEASEQAELVPASKGILQLAYTSKADAFSKLIEAVKTNPLYQPNEPDYTLASLEAKLTELMQKNESVAVARKDWRMKVLERNKVLYSNEDSMVMVARAVKKYVRGLFGHDSSEYALVKVLSIENPGLR
jgi:hypothetical protein